MTGNDMQECIPANNLLDQPFFTIDQGCAVTLPGLLAASARGEVTDFPRLRAHQRTAWHCFRVQLAALAMRAEGLSEPPQAESAWAALLRNLSAKEGAEGDGPWCLTVADRSAPAFMQAPDPGGLAWHRVRTPDALDMLITARNHDLKAAIAEAAVPEDWIYALVTLQTSEGYGGQGNNGIARMNGGASSRPFVGAVSAGEGGAPEAAKWWRRDLGVLLSSAGDEGPLALDGPALLWCRPWKEKEALPAESLHRWMIEICRRVRLSEGEGGELYAQRSGSAKPRIEAKTFNGALGDPWTPVEIKGSKALTLSGGRFDYRRVVELVLADPQTWIVPPAAILRAGEGASDMLLVTEALARGNSKTDGLQSRIVLIPKRLLGLFASDRARLAAAAQALIEEIRFIDSALREAVALYAAGGDGDRVGKRERKRAAGARARLDAAADAVFFEHLWMRIDDGAKGEAAFRRMLASTARAELTRAFNSFPCAQLRRPRAKLRAQILLATKMRDFLPAREQPE